jgi:peptidoglycan hydrolase-like protein with peptidoglycan-binding domain
MRPAESFVEQPVRSLQYMLRVIAEDEQRLPTVIPDGIYGPETMQAVSAFQRSNGLAVTGVADQVLWDAVTEAYEDALIRIGPAQPIEIIMDPGQVYVLGDSSPYIYLLQSMLTQLSKEHSAIPAPNHNGILDNSTVEALIAFQILANLPPEGTLDKITWKHLVHQFTLNAHHNATRSTQQSYSRPQPNRFINLDY